VAKDRVQWRSLVQCSKAVTGQFICDHYEGHVLPVLSERVTWQIS
jgi:hypothetical protein